MGKKPLIWASLLVLLLSVPVLLHARVGIPFVGHSQHKMDTNQSTGDQSSPYRSGYDQGYPRGFDNGKTAHSSGSAYDFDDNKDYKDPDDIGWTSAMGNKKEFEKGFRSGFKLGYQDGYSGKEPQLAVAPPLPQAQPLAAEATPPQEQQTQAPSELARTEESAGTSPYRSGWDSGYKSGYEGGQADHNQGAKLDEDDAPGYKGDHAFCESIEGKGEHQCRKGYREGFKLGYQDGYSGLVSRLITPQAPAQSQAAAPANQPETPSQPEQPPSTAMQETPQQPSKTEAQNQPRALPKTASSLPLLGLLGLSAIALSLLSRALRKTGTA